MTLSRHRENLRQILGVDFVKENSYDPANKVLRDLSHFSFLRNFNFGGASRHISKSDKVINRLPNQDSSEDENNKLERVPSALSKLTGPSYGLSDIIRSGGGGEPS